MGWVKGRPRKEPTPEQKERHKQAMNRPEVKEKLRQANLGRKNPNVGKLLNERRHLFEEKRLAKLRSPEVRAKISNTLTGRKINPEIVEKVRQKLKGRKLSPELVEKMKGRVFSEQALENIRNGIRNNRYNEEYGKKLSKEQTGEKNNQAKLKESQVLEIRRLYATANYTQFALADLFGVARSTIQGIVLRKTWKHI